MKQSTLKTPSLSSQGEYLPSTQVSGKTKGRLPKREALIHQSPLILFEIDIEIEISSQE